MKFIIFLFMTTLAFSAQLANISYPETMTYQNKNLVLNGLGLREATWLKVDVYVAALYLEKKNADESDIIQSGQNKKLEMTFVRDVEKEKVVKSYEESFEKVLAEKKVSQQNEINQFLSKMQEMKKGQSMGLGFHGDITELSFDKKTVAQIKSSDFQKTLLSIWLGANPPNTGLKHGLLGK